MIDVYRGQGDYTQATAAVKEAIKLEPDDPEVLVAFGTLCLELGNAEGAQMALERLQFSAPGHPAVPLIQQVLAAA